MKNIRVFNLKIFSFLEVKFSTYLNRRVFVMGVISRLCSVIVSLPEHLLYYLPKSSSSGIMVRTVANPSAVVL